MVNKQLRLTLGRTFDRTFMNSKGHEINLNSPIKRGRVCRFVRHLSSRMTFAEYLAIGTPEHGIYLISAERTDLPAKGVPILYTIKHAFNFRGS